MREEGWENLCQGAVWLILFTSSFLSSSLFPPTIGLFLLLVDPVYLLPPRTGLALGSWPHKTLFGIKIILAPGLYIYCSRLCLVMLPLSLDLSDESSFPLSLSHVPSLYFRSYIMAFQIFTKSLKEDLFYHPKPPSLCWWPRILYTLIPQVESSQALCLYGLHANHPPFCIPSDYVLESSCIVIVFQS